MFERLDIATLSQLMVWLGGRGSLFVQPVADEQSEWGILFKTITHVTLFCEILHLKF